MRRSLVTFLAVGLGIASALSAAPAPQTLDTLPADRANGDLKVTIQGLSRMDPPGGGDPTDPNENSWTRIGVKLDWGDRPTIDWQPTAIELTDSRGDTYVPRRTSSYFRKGEGQVCFSGPLWSTSEPWHVRLSFARTNPRPTYEYWKVFDQDEILTVAHVPAPAEGKVIQDGRKAERQGATVELLGYAGPHAVIPDAFSFKYEHPSVQYRIHRPKNVHVSFLRATDADGKLIPLGASAGGYSPKGEAEAKELLVPQDVHEVFLAFAVHRDRVFEFTAVPSG